MWSEPAHLSVVVKCPCPRLGTGHIMLQACPVGVGGVVVRAWGLWKGWLPLSPPSWGPSDGPITSRLSFSSRK